LNTNFILMKIFTFFFLDLRSILKVKKGVRFMFNINHKNCHQTCDVKLSIVANKLEEFDCITYGACEMSKVFMHNIATFYVATI